MRTEKRTVFVTKDTHEALKDYSERTGTKMYKFVSDLVMREIAQKN